MANGRSSNVMRPSRSADGDKRMSRTAVSIGRSSSSNNVFAEERRHPALERASTLSPTRMSRGGRKSRRSAKHADMSRSQCIRELRGQQQSYAVGDQANSNGDTNTGRKSFVHSGSAPSRETVGGPQQDIVFGNNVNIGKEDDSLLPARSFKEMCSALDDIIEKPFFVGAKHGKLGESSAIQRKPRSEFSLEMSGVYGIKKPRPQSAHASFKCREFFEK